MDTLWSLNIAIEAMGIETVSFTINAMVISHSDVNVYQRVLFVYSYVNIYQRVSMENPWDNETTIDTMDNLIIRDLLGMDSEKRM